MRKRIIAFLMTLICIFVQANTVFAETEAFSDRTAGKADAEYLSMLRIIDDGINFEENVSRGMAIYTVLNALGQAEAAAGYDVPADFEEKNHIYAASAAYALLWGIITGETAEELRLDEAAAYSEVAEMLVRGLGYSAEAERLGGYTEYSVKLGLNKGVNKAGGNAINGYDLARCNEIVVIR